MGTTTPAIIVSVLIILTVFVISTRSKFKQKCDRFTIAALADSLAASIKPALVSIFGLSVGTACGDYRPRSSDLLNVFSLTTLAACELIRSKRFETVPKRE